MPSVLHAACRNYSCGLLFANTKRLLYSYTHVSYATKYYVKAAELTETLARVT